ncbi:MAG: PIN/TRAM domain-containing protein [Planctomycetota bacterium]
MLLNIIDIGQADNPGEQSIRLATQWWLPVFATVLLAGLFLTVDLLTPNKKLQTIGGVLLGLVAGLVAALAASVVIDLIATSWDFPESAVTAAAKVILGISFCYLGVSVVLQTQDDFRLVIPYVEFAKQIRGPRPLVVDTSALIDARITDVGETGLIQSPIIIPAFVINELQTLADSSDKLKRSKGRRGLDIVSRIQRSARLDVSVDETPVPGKAVDQMLVELARRMPAVIVTADVALTRIAGFQNVSVINLNELANAMKPAFVSGERTRVRLIRPGEQEGQAVGYLDDGTMVIAENGSDHIGDEVDLEIRSTLQTQAGRLIFARVPPLDTLGTDGTDGTDSTDNAQPGMTLDQLSQATQPSPMNETPDQKTPAQTEAPEPAPQSRAKPLPPHRDPSLKRGPFPKTEPTPNPSRNPRRSSPKL